MNSANNSNSTFHSTAVFVTNYNDISSSLASRFLQKGICVYIVTLDEEKWLESNNLRDDRVRVVSPHNNTIDSSFEYFFYSQISNDREHRTFDTTLLSFSKNLLHKFNPKVTLLFPYQVSAGEENQLEKVLEEFTFNEKTPVSYYVDIFFERDDGNVDLKGKVFKDAYPVPTSEVVRILERSFFSFGSHDTRIAILSDKHSLSNHNNDASVQVSVDSVIKVENDFSTKNEIDKALLTYSSLSKELPKVSPDLQPREQIESQTGEAVINEVKMESNVSQVISPVKTSVNTSQRSESLLLVPDIRPLKISQDGINKADNARQLKLLGSARIAYFWSIKYVLIKSLHIVLLIVTLLVIVPLLLQLTASGLLYVSKYFVENDENNIASIALELTSSVNEVSSSYLRLLEYGPLRPFYSKQIVVVDTIDRISVVGTTYLEAVETSESLLINIFDKNPSQISELSHKLGLELDYLERELGFLETSHFDSNFLQIILGSVNLSELRQKVNGYKHVALKSPELLGTTSPEHYIILLQNSTIHRASGGVVTAVIIPTFSGGKIIDIDVYDPAYLDSQIKGKVEVPIIVSSYLSKDVWSFSDALIASDFPKNAAHISWYLDKSLDLNAKGVIVVDSRSLDFVLRKLSLSDVDMSTDGIRLLAEDIIKNISNNKIQSNDFYKTLLSHFKNKNILVSFEDRTMSDLLERFNLTSGISINKCNGNCYTDLVGIVETTKTGSIDNNTINRFANFSVNFEQGLIKRNLVIAYENKGANSYSSLISVLTPEDAGFESVRVVKKANVNTTPPVIYANNGYKEAAVELEIEPNETVTFSYHWESGSSLSTAIPGSYELTIMKQAGIPNFDYNINYVALNNTQLTSDLILSLTRDGVYRYNTQLESDLINKISW